ncbi:MAG TPA: PLP-dependent transferase, partial [Candidatus Bathyarchaeia archaeon]|nr:PLP-dependent transferase [Candidatus Bathyarchaeia archaeon]
IAHTAGALLLIDSTFASPINQNPLTVGADLVLHSATKFINGHDDLVAGLAIGSKEHIRKIKILRRDLGGVLDPIPAWLVLRGIKTMALRIRAQNANALALAKYLSGHNKVAKVNYPGLETHPQHALARKQMRGYGGMLSFEIKGDKREAIKLTESLKVASLAASLGGVETLVSQPHNMTHTQMSPEERARAGMPDTLIRVSVGIEDIEDLIADFTQALARI